MLIYWRVIEKWSGWWVGTCFIFPFSWESSSQLTNSIIFQRGRYTTNQEMMVDDWLMFVFGGTKGDIFLRWSSWMSDSRWMMHDTFDQRCCCCFWGVITKKSILYVYGREYIYIFTYTCFCNVLFIWFDFYWLSYSLPNTLNAIYTSVGKR
jgi:hypothetical protein